ncbi:MAG: glycosyltransferase family 87 protein [Acidobacteriota bacterium]
MLNKRILIIIFSIIALALLGFIFIRNLIDFPVYYSAGRSLIAGRTDLYSSDFARGPLMDYRYPPFFLLAFYPLWLLPYSAAAYLWHLLSVSQIAGCVCFLHRLASASKAAWVIAALATAGYFVMILHYGNAHLLAIFLLFGSFYFAAEKKDSLSAAMMALSITIKLTPVFILPYFVITRRWKILLLTVVFLAVLNLAPAAYFGFQKNAELLRAWHDHVIRDQEFHETNGPINLSLKGQLRRYLTEVDYSLRQEGDTRYPNVNFLSLTSHQTDRLWIVFASAIYLFACILIWQRRRRCEGDKESYPIELGLMICLMLMMGPLTSKIYFIALLWPVFALARFAMSAQAVAVRRVLIFIAAANSILPLLPGRSIQRWLLVAGADFFVNLLLMAALLYVLTSNPASSTDARRTQARSSATDA